MAEVDSGSGGGKKKKHGSKTKKVSTKIDMTPMVDLGFLLITFFMLATTFNKPKTMEVNVPDKEEKEDKKQELKESNAFTIILGKDNKVYYYSGVTDPKAEITNFDANGIRKILLEKKSNPDLVVIIKAAEDSKYKNIVDILDEMAITSTKRYAMVDIATIDKELMRIADNGGVDASGNKPN